MASTPARFESSGFLPVGTPKYPCVCSSCWHRRGISHYGSLSEYPQLTWQLWTDAAVHDETCRGVHWNLTNDILSTCYKCTLSTLTHKLNVSGHRDIFPRFGVRNLCPKFVHTFQLHLYNTVFAEHITYLHFLKKCNFTTPYRASLRVSYDSQNKQGYFSKEH
jgi:hypothetical protein